MGLRVWIFIATYNYPNSVTKSNCLASKFIPFCSEVNRVNLRDLCLTRSNNFKTSKMSTISIWKIIFLEVSLWKSKTVQVFLDYSLIHLSTGFHTYLFKRFQITSRSNINLNFTVMVINIIYRIYFLNVWIRNVKRTFISSNRHKIEVCTLT